MFASRVLPGAALVRATRVRTSALINVDLPTFERPTSAISGAPSRGKSAAATALRTKDASIFTGFGIRGSGFGGIRLVSNPRESQIPNPESRLMSDGVGDDAAVDRLGLRIGRQPARQPLGQPDVHGLVHRPDHEFVQLCQPDLRAVRQFLL